MMTHLGVQDSQLAVPPHLEDGVGCNDKSCVFTPAFERKTLTPAGQMSGREKRLHFAIFHVCLGRSNMGKASRNGLGLV